MIDCAFILAGGKGSRLAPWPAPKALLPISGVPMIYRLIDHVSPHVSRIVVCTGYRAGDVKHALSQRFPLGQDRDDGPRVDISDAGENAQMTERLVKAREEFGIGGRALILYGDELADVDIRALVAHHETTCAPMTFTVVRYRLPFGVVTGNRVFDDTDVDVNIGFVIAEPDCWKFASWRLPVIDEASKRLRPGAEVRFRDLATWINWVSGVVTYRHEGKRATVNSHADIEHAEEVWR